MTPTQEMEEVTSKEIVNEAAGTPRELLRSEKKKLQKLEANAAKRSKALHEHNQKWRNLYNAFVKDYNTLKTYINELVEAGKLIEQPSIKQLAEPTDEGGNHKSEATLQKAMP